MSLVSLSDLDSILFLLKNSDTKVRFFLQYEITTKKAIAYWSIDLQTTIPLHQIVFEPVQGKKYTIKYFIETKNDVLPVCASIPDMIFGDVALLVHP
jgi:valyl-tRNA synthetase